MKWPTCIHASKFGLVTLASAVSFSPVVLREQLCVRVLVHVDLGNQDAIKTNIDEITVGI